MHDNTSWKVSIQSMDYRIDSQIFIYRYMGSHIEWLEVQKEGELIVRTAPHQRGAMSPVKPIMVCPTELAMDISKGFVEYANSQGFKNGDETFNKGKLEATERHLEDMRKIVFEPIINGVEIKKR